MPRFFFHLHTDRAIDQDTTGVVFPTLEAAIADARLALAEYMRDENICSAPQRSQCRFEIEDQNGKLVATVPKPDQ
jgi:hypothetical protein